ncbi:MULTISPECIES: TadE/TadG family type IV pilus assembly protein [Agrobacterium]|uniref:TadE/TadG family type IV pilus assembly protein n=1 Tax=Agrobacterium tumefaciens TaxID=358 RepID=A0AAF0GX73_AGRTU|nr:MULTISPECIES: TadE/TadG family type IV pilus assembly protein [Agrobacterium]TZG36916.1 pilus assembly protein TadE [Agrobacterium sp. B1(2019)]WGM60406.1 TadE/TadG family type IV pilus assembly protein [Agrobacterium tumefaciens]
MKSFLSPRQDKSFGGPRRCRFAYAACCRLFGDRKAATAVETALLLPLFFALIFGTLEIGLLMLYYLYLSFASNAGIEYLRKAAADGRPATEIALRKAIASHFIGGTDETNLKIALLPIPDDDIAEAKVPIPIVNDFRPPADTAGQYILAIGYQWSFLMPTTRFLVPSTDGVPQLRNISLAITAVKVSE